jgi:hypothetical protein
MHSRRQTRFREADEEEERRNCAQRSGSDNINERAASASALIQFPLETSFLITSKQKEQMLTNNKVTCLLRRALWSTPRHVIRSSKKSSVQDMASRKYWLLRQILIDGQQFGLDSEKHLLCASYGDAHEIQPQPERNF